MKSTKGLIIKQSDYGEGNRMLTIFTEDFGIIKAAIYGVKGAKSRQSAASQFLSWAEFLLFFGKGNIASVNSLSSIESFFPIHEDLEKLALATYMADITYHSQEENVKNPDLLKFLLNTLYVMANKDIPLKKLKAIYELKIIKDMGYTPVLGECTNCAKKGEVKGFSAEDGGILCGDCFNKIKGHIPIKEATRRALLYVLTSPDNKVFSFNVSEEILREMCHIAEEYLLYRTERNFSSLDYLKKVLT